MDQEKLAAAYQKIEQEVTLPLFWQAYEKEAGVELMPKTEAEAEKLLKVAGALLADRDTYVQPSESAIDRLFAKVEKAANAQQSNPDVIATNITNSLLNDAQYLEAASILAAAVA